MAVFKRGGILLHCAGVVRNQRAFLFFGHSGSGKTTVARLSPNDIVLNDDLVTLLPSETGWLAHGTPFTNPTQNPPSNQSAPAAALLRLVQSKTVRLESLSRANAVAELLSNIPVLPQNPAQLSQIIARLESLLDSLPAWYLHFLPDDSFWNTVDGIDSI
jgi:hypothetical protein